LSSPKIHGRNYGCSTSSADEFVGPTYHMIKTKWVFKAI